MKTVLIVYHSQSGTSARLAAAIAAGVGEESGVQRRLLRASDAGADDLLAADGLVLVGAENSGALAGGLKDFLDRVFYPAMAAARVMPYVLAISAGNDGTGAQREAERILRGIPFVAATEALLLRGESCPEHLRQGRELGQAFATGLEMGIF
jgi:multimeric flavodoxin WrbA